MRTLTELAEEAYANAVTVLAEDHAVGPLFLFQDQRDQTHLLMTPYRSETEKLITYRCVREILREQPEVRAYAFISEAWTVTRAPDQELTRLPRDCSDRVSVLLVSAHDRDGNFVTITAEILPDFTVKCLPAYEMRESGRASNFFQPEETLH